MLIQKVTNVLFLGFDHHDDFGFGGGFGGGVGGFGGFGFKRSLQERMDSARAMIQGKDIN